MNESGHRFLALLRDINIGGKNVISKDDLLAKLPPLKQKFESVTTAPGVIFWTVSKRHQSKTTMMKLAASDIYQRVTVRNHNTVFKLLALFDEI